MQLIDFDENFAALPSPSKSVKGKTEKQEEAEKEDGSGGCEGGNKVQVTEVQMQSAQQDTHVQEINDTGTHTAAIELLTPSHPLPPAVAVEGAHGTDVGAHGGLEGDKSNEDSTRAGEREGFLKSEGAAAEVHEEIEDEQSAVASGCGDGWDIDGTVQEVRERDGDWMEGATGNLDEEEDEVDTAGRGDGGDIVKAARREEVVKEQQVRGSVDGGGAQEAAATAHAQAELAAVILASRPEKEAAASAAESATRSASPRATCTGGGEVGASLEEVAQLKHVVAERERQLEQKSEECAGARMRADSLENMVSKMKKVMEDLSVENSERMDEVEQLKEALVSEQHKAAAASKHVNALQDASSSASDVAAKLTEAEAAREELLREGQRLMEDKQKLEATVKELRKSLKSKQDLLNKALEDKTEVEKMAEGMEKELKSAGITYEKNAEKMQEIRNMSSETAKQLSKAEKDKASLQARAEAVERLVEEVPLCAFACE